MEFFLLGGWQLRRRTAEKRALLWNEAVTVEELHDHCGKEIANRVAGRHVLAIQDTTEPSYQRHARRTRGPVGNGSEVGIFLHPTLGIDAENGHCLGLIGAQIYVRREEDVENQIALLHARVAALKKAKATLTLTQQEFERTSQLVESNAASRELYDQRQAALSIARGGVVQALADVNQIRVSLGLQAQAEDSADLEQVPPDLDQTFSSVLQTQAALIQASAELGVVHSYNQTPKQMLEEFEKLDPEGDINRTFDRLAA